MNSSACSAHVLVNAGLLRMLLIAVPVVQLLVKRLVAGDDRVDSSKSFFTSLHDLCCGWVGRGAGDQRDAKSFAKSRCCSIDSIQNELATERAAMKAGFKKISLDSWKNLRLSVRRLSYRSHTSKVWSRSSSMGETARIRSELNSCGAQLAPLSVVNNR